MVRLMGLSNNEARFAAKSFGVKVVEGLRRCAVIVVVEVVGVGAVRASDCRENPPTVELSNGA